ncbi:MAG: 16S rRNA (guanine(527)-N(7))-methyltransferase RsmG [Bacillota bacterium]
MEEGSIREQLASAGVTLTDWQVERLLIHLKHVLRFNARLNLVAASDAARLVRRHLVDSLLGVRWLAATAGSAGLRVVDVGSGGGFPGLVAGVACPGWEVTLLDSAAKKVGFLLSAADAMGLTNVRVVRGRAGEGDLGVTMEGAPRWDLCVSRAVAPVWQLAGLCAPLLRRGGACGWWKGPGAIDELREGADRLRGEGLLTVQRYVYWLPGEDISRAIIVAKKMKVRREGRGEREESFRRE